MRITILAMLIPLVLLSGCAPPTSAEAPSTAPTTMSTTISATDEIQTVIINGERDVMERGEPFTQEEISSAIEFETPLMDMTFEQYTLVESGYYHLLALGNFILNFNELSIPIINDGYIIGSLTIIRNKGEISTHVAENTGASGEKIQLQRLMEKYDDDIVMIYASGCEFAVTSDNEVHLMSGFGKADVKNDDNLYEKLKSEYTTVSYSKVLG